MILHGFYNPTAVGDVLMLRLGSGVTTKVDSKDNVTILYDENDTIIGYNIFDAKNTFSNLNEGLVKMNVQLVEQVNTVLSKYDLPNVEHDCKSKFIVGLIERFEKHPDSDHLNICQVNLGQTMTQIVCGANNVSANKKVVVACIGAVMPSGLIIQPSVLRKVESNGMLCSAKELKIDCDSSVKGILLLDEHYVVGEEFI